MHAFTYSVHLCFCYSILILRKSGMLHGVKFENDVFHRMRMLEREDNKLMLQIKIQEQELGIQHALILKLNFLKFSYLRSLFALILLKAFATSKRFFLHSAI